jgi:hypothetical protein
MCARAGERILRDVIFTAFMLHCNLHIVKNMGTYFVLRLSEAKAWEARFKFSRVCDDKSKFLTSLSRRAEASISICDAKFSLPKSNVNSSRLSKKFSCRGGDSKPLPNRGSDDRFKKLPDCKFRSKFGSDPKFISMPGWMVPKLSKLSRPRRVGSVEPEFMLTVKCVELPGLLASNFTCDFASPHAFG